MTGTMRNFPLLRPFKKSVPDRTSRHSHRTFYQNDIFLFRLQVSVLVGLRRVTFPGRHKTGCHLHAVRAKLQPGLRVPPVIDSARHDHRNCLAGFLRPPSHCGQNSFYLFLIVQSRDIFQLTPVKTQMSSGQRSLNHDQIRQAVVFFLPVVENDLCGFQTGADRSQKRAALRSDFLLRFPHRLRKRNGKARSGNNQIHTCQDGLAYIFFIAPGGNHDVHADDSAGCKLPCSVNFHRDLPQIRLMRIPVIARLPIADLCC